MLVATSHAEAASVILEAIASAPIVVHEPPIPTNVVSGPAALVQSPQAIEVKTLRGAECHWRFRFTILVIAGSTTGKGLIENVDAICSLLIAAGIQITTSPQVYQPPNTPAPIPAVLIQGE
jgi:hypothetical protein